MLFINRSSKKLNTMILSLYHKNDCNGFDMQKLLRMRTVGIIFLIHIFALKATSKSSKKINYYIVRYMSTKSRSENMLTIIVQLVLHSTLHIYFELNG